MERERSPERSPKRRKLEPQNSGELLPGEPQPGEFQSSWPDLIITGSAYLGYQGSEIPDGSGLYTGFLVPSIQDIAGVPLPSVAMISGLNWPVLPTPIEPYNFFGYANGSFNDSMAPYGVGFNMDTAWNTLPPTHSIDWEWQQVSGGSLQYRVQEQLSTEPLVDSFNGLVGSEMDVDVESGTSTHLPNFAAQPWVSGVSIDIQNTPWATFPPVYETAAPCSLPPISDHQFQTEVVIKPSPSPEFNLQCSSSGLGLDEEAADPLLDDDSDLLCFGMVRLCGPSMQNSAYRCRFVNRKHNCRMIQK